MHETIRLFFHIFELREGDLRKRVKACLMKRWQDKWDTRGKNKITHVGMISYRKTILAKISLKGGKNRRNIERKGVCGRWYKRRCFLKTVFCDFQRIMFSHWIRWKKVSKTGLYKTFDADCAESRFSKNPSSGFPDPPGKTLFKIAEKNKFYISLYKI